MRNRFNNQKAVVFPGTMFAKPNLVKGQALLIVVIIFLFIMLSIVMGVAYAELSALRVIRGLERSTQSYAVAESLLEDNIYRLNNSYAVATLETMTLDGFTARATTTNTLTGKNIISGGDADSRIRRVETHLRLGTGAAFNFGVQTDVGGFIMENNSEVNGNLFSNGTVVGSNNNLIRGDVISAGPDGLMDNIHATGTAYAHTIEDSTIDGDAHYQVIDAETTVGGVKFPDSSDQATSTLPISDEQIAEWEQDAEAGGVISGPCPYVISEDVTIGPVKILCDVAFSGTNFTATIAGMVWVTGDISFKNSPTLRIDPSLNDLSVALIADDPDDRLASSTISIQNSTQFEDSGTQGSYILLVSQNESAEQGGDVAAITLEQSANGDVLVYAGHGEVRLKNSVDLREVTGWRVRLQNFSQVTYESGLASLLFTAGPGGGYEIETWEEVE